MRLIALVLLTTGCERGVQGTVIYTTDTIRACPSDRALVESDLDCVCGISSTIVDTVLSAYCDELWCHPDELELECITYGDTGASSSGGSGT